MGDDVPATKLVFCAQMYVIVLTAKTAVASQTAMAKLTEIQKYIQIHCLYGVMLSTGHPLFFHFGDIVQLI